MLYHERVFRHRFGITASESFDIEVVLRFPDEAKPPEAKFSDDARQEFVIASPI